ncbi:MAG: hypothetical protein IJV97_02595 [Alphaproteobacteria bacterium]|nr:hypothetical protein [Alphaproteobacteria bacterium]
MRKLLMITSAILGLGCLYPTTISAQTCTAAPSCADMGYTKTVSDCSGKTTLKCPFDLTKVSCEDGDSSSGGEWDWENSISCSELNYTEVTLNGLELYKMPLGTKGCYLHLGGQSYTSTVKLYVLDAEDNILPGSGYSGSVYGSTTTCVDDKTTIAVGNITTGSLSSSNTCMFIPYKGGFTVKDTSSCEVGDYYLDDNTCTSSLVGKAIGVVIDAKNRKIASLKPTSTKFATSLSDYESVYSSLTSTTDGKGNTNKLIAAGVDKFPAAKYCNDLTDGGKSWYLPATDEIVVPQALAKKINNSLSSSVTSSARVLTSTSWGATYIYCKYVNKEGTTWSEANFTQFVLCIAKY